MKRMRLCNDTRGLSIFCMEPEMNRGGSRTFSILRFTFENKVEVLT